MNADAFNERRRNSSPSVNSLLRLTGSDERSVQHLKEKPVQRSPLTTCSHLWFQTDKKSYLITRKPHLRMQAEERDASPRRKLIATTPTQTATTTKFAHLSDFQQKSTRMMKRERNIGGPTEDSSSHLQRESIKTECLNEKFLLDECFYEVELCLLVLTDLLVSIKDSLVASYYSSRTSHPQPPPSGLSTCGGSAPPQVWGTEGQGSSSSEEDEEEFKTASADSSGAELRLRRVGGGGLRAVVVGEWIPQYLGEFRLVGLLSGFAVVVAVVLLLLTSGGGRSVGRTPLGASESSSTNVAAGPQALVSLARLLHHHETTFSFGLSVSCTVVTSVSALTLFLHFQSTKGHHGLPFYWSKFVQPDRVLFPILWTAFLADLLFHSSSLAHPVLVAVAIKVINYYHHYSFCYHRGGGREEPSGGGCASVGGVSRKEQLLSSSSKLSSAFFAYFVVIRRLGSTVWPTLPIFTHFLGLLGLLLGQLCVQKLSRLISPHPPSTSTRPHYKWGKKDISLSAQVSNNRQVSSATLPQGSSGQVLLSSRTILSQSSKQLVNNSHTSVTQDVQEVPRRKAFRLSWLETGLIDSGENDGHSVLTLPVGGDDDGLSTPTGSCPRSRGLLNSASRAPAATRNNKRLSSVTSEHQRGCLHTPSGNHSTSCVGSAGEEPKTSTGHPHPSSSHFMSICLERYDVNDDPSSLRSEEEVVVRAKSSPKSVSFSRPRSNSLFLKILDDEGLSAPPCSSSVSDISEKPRNGVSCSSPSPPQKRLFRSESQCFVSGVLGSCDRMRRTSLPAALPAQRASIHHGSSGVDSSLLYEAHGIITEMLLDQTALPPSVVAGLKALATLLKPTSVPIHCNPRPRPAPLTLSTDPDYTSDVDEIPYTGEKLSSMPKRNSGPGKKGVSANLLRRMSTSTWTTTTSATGMPTLEPQPHSRRRRSASFRSTMEGTPGSSPTQQCGLVPIIFPDKERESQPKGTPVSPAFASFKMGFVGTSGCASGPLSSGHSKNAALQASHKARSFSAFALNASTDSRRRFSQQEFSNSNQNQRKTVCSLHPLSPSDLTHLNALAASTGISTNAGSGIVKSASASVSAAGSNRSSPVGTPLPSPIPSPVPSRDPSPCNYRHNQRRDSATTAGDIPPSRTSLIDSSSSSLSRKSLSPSNSTTNLSTPTNNPPSQASTGHQPPPTASTDPPKVIFQSTHEEETDGSILVNDGDSLGLLSGKNLTTSSYLDNPDEDCSNASTLGDGPGPPDSSSGHSNSVRLSPVTFTLQEPQDQDQDGLPLEEDYRDAVIITSDEVQFNLPAIASDSYLCRLNEWDYPIFELERSSKTQILSHMCYKVFLETGLFETFRIPIKEFISYFHALELGYRDKPYHNRMHAADVLQGVFYFTTQAIPGFQMIPPDPDTPNADWPGHRPCFNVEEASYGIMGANFPALELMALYTAAAMHDYDHPGRTNAFLVTTHSPHAILYNDRSVLENHHAAAAWGLLLNNEEFNFLKYLDKAEFKRFRFLVIEAILATDLKRHFEILSEFNSKMNEDDSPGIDWSSEEDRLLVMEVCIKLADINGPCKFHDIHVQWTYRIAEEFYEQGDEEVRLGLPISPFMDRYHPQLAKLQESFINHLVAPLCKACAEAGLLPGYWEDDDDDEEPNDGEATGDEVSIMSCPETDNENDESSYSDDIKNESRRLKRKIFCVHTKHLQDNHRYWMNVIKEEAKKKEEGIKTESVAISTEDPMETIEEENNTPHSLNRSFSFEKEDSKL